jgi:hypothetical protein
MLKVSFGEKVKGIDYKVLDEREVRASAGIMFLMGLIAMIPAIFFQNYKLIPYMSGFMMLSFMISVFINPNYSPAQILAKLITYKQNPIYIGAIQKRFAWSLGLCISALVFFMSIPLQTNASLFEPTCMLCLICMLLMFLETAFGICVGCQIYFLTLRLGILKQPEIKPNCMGNSCEV